MSRKPVNQISSLETREALWHAIRAFGRPFTSRELLLKTRCTINQVSEYLRGLSAAGILDVQQAKGQSVTGIANLYTLLKDCGVEAPRVRRDGSEVTQGRGREQMWETMRAMSSFSARDIQIFASTDEHPVAASEASTYCFYLAKAGFLRRDGDRYFLIHRSGPKPPMIQRTKQVFDPNTGEIVWRK